MRIVTPSRARKPPLTPPVRAAPSLEVSTKAQPFEQVAAIVLGGLQSALSELLAAAPEQLRRAADVERAFGIDYKLSWQIYRIANGANPLAVGGNVPARVSMKKLLTAAARRRIPSEVVRRVSEAFEQFENLVQSEAGDREEFEAMLSAFIPEERASQELAAKQLIFKGVSQIKGLAVEAEFAAMFMHPSVDGTTIDRASLLGEIGLRRVRPDALIRIGSGDRSKPHTPVLTLDGKACDGPTAAFLAEYSTSPLPRFETHESPNGMIHYRVAGEEVGMRSAVDLVMADRRAQVLPLYWEPNAPRMRGLLNICRIPTKRMTLDAFVHKDVYPGVTPQLATYDTIAEGAVAKFDDPARESDRLRLQDSVRPILGGISGARLPHMPRYVEMLEHVCTKLGWDSAAFRGYRVDVHYPVHGAEYILWFELPEAPSKTLQ